MLKGDKVILRAVEPSDAAMLMLWENDTENWKVTDTEVPFSLHGIMQLIDHQQDLRATGQLRFLICELESEKPVGTIDLYDADFRNGNAALGILIANHQARKKGYALQSVELLLAYAEKILELHNVTCSIQATNTESIRLFEKAGFQKVGVRKEWFRAEGKRIDEMIYQRCLKIK
jgi:diamine N-acetyltransferase